MCNIVTKVTTLKLAFNLATKAVKKCWWVEHFLEVIINIPHHHCSNIMASRATKRLLIMVSRQYRGKQFKDDIAHWNFTWVHWITQSLPPFIHEKRALANNIRCISKLKLRLLNSPSLDRGWFRLDEFFGLYCWPSEEAIWIEPFSAALPEISCVSRFRSTVMQHWRRGEESKDLML